MSTELNHPLQGFVAGPRPSASAPIPRLDVHPSIASLPALGFAQLQRPDLWPAGLTLADLKAAQPAILQSLAAASPFEIAKAVEFLRARYRARAAEPEWMADADATLWLAALAHWPPDVLNEAVFAWCCADKRFPPSVPGELMAFGAPILRAREAIAWAVEVAIAAGEEAQARAGAPLASEAEVAALIGGFRRTLRLLKQPEGRA